MKNDYLERLSNYDPIYLKIWNEVTPHLKKGRNIDFQHTIDALTILFDILDSDKNLKKNHSILIPAVMLHDCGWSKVPKKIRDVSYGDVKVNNQGKILHQKEGVRIAEEILERNNYDKGSIREIAYIVSIHDRLKNYEKVPNAKLVAELDKLVRYKHYLFWELIHEGKFTFESRIEFLEKGINKWFSIPKLKKKAKELLYEREKEKSKF